MENLNVIKICLNEKDNNLNVYTLFNGMINEHVIVMSYQMVIILYKKKISILLDSYVIASVMTCCLCVLKCGLKIFCKDLMH